MDMWCFVYMYIMIQFLGIINLREKQGLNIFTDDDDVLIIRLYIVIERLLVVVSLHQSDPLIQHNACIQNTTSPCKYILEKLCCII